MAYLNIDSITHSFGKNSVLNDVTFNGNLGEIIGIFGRNGAGKSTLLNLLFRRFKIQNGSITINNKDLGSIKYQDQLVGYLPQYRILPKEHKVRDVIAMTCPNGEIQDRIFYAPGINAISNRYVYQLSHGNLKYLSALLILHQPHPIILLDEPFSMVDPLIREQFRKLLKNKKKDKLIILTDHYYKDVFEISDKRYVLNKGFMQAVQHLEDLKKHGYIP
ncbi:MAG: ATP-binding cassette domain-containing protein [Gilvibacter sp.]